MNVRNVGPLVRHAAFLGVGGALLASSCILDRSGRDDLATGGTGNTGGAGGAGGSLQCNTIDDCPDPESQCEEKSCASGWCGIHHLVQGSMCHEDGGQVCDGQGNCVKTEGVECTEPGECLSSHCTDGVCCNWACDGECETCGDAAPIIGTCAPFSAGSDPESDCGTGSCDGAHDCANGDHVFSEQYGESGEQWPRAIAVGPADEIVLGGNFDGAIDLGGGTRFPTNSDGYVVKRDAAGAYIWDRQFGASGNEYVHGVAVDSLGNVFVCGFYDGSLDLGDGSGEVLSEGSYDLFLQKLDPSGNPLWNHRFGDVQSQVCRGLAVDSLNNVIMVATLNGSVDFGAGTLSGLGDGDIVVAKWDDDGALLWANKYGDTWFQEAAEVAVDGSDRIVVVGSFSGTLNFGGSSLVAGSVTRRDAFVVRFDPGGGHIFSKDYGEASENDYAEGVAIDAVHHIVVAGHFEGDIDLGSGTHTTAGSSDGFVVRLNGSGEHQWDRAFDADDWLAPWAVAIDDSNNVIVGGEYYGGADFGGGTLTTNGGYDVFLAKYSYDGVPLWSGTYGDDQDQWLEVLATNSQNQIIVGGHFDGTIDFGDNPLPSDGTDLYLAILAP